VLLTDVRPALPDGVTLKVEDFDRSGLMLTNRTTTPAYALDPTGKPFLRVTSTDVYGDADSVYLAYTRVVAKTAETTKLDCCPQGRWVRLAGQGMWGWADPRLDPAQFRPDVTGTPGSSRGLAALSSDAPLATWKVGLRYGQKTLTADGVLKRRHLQYAHSAVDRSPAGVSTTVIESDPPLLHMNATPGSTVAVQDSEGQDFIRMGPQGTFIDSQSVEYRANQRSLGLPPASAEDTWVQMPGATTTAVTWEDDRLTSTATAVTSGGQSSSPVRWQIPLTVNGTPGHIEGSSVQQSALLPAVEPEAKKGGILSKSASTGVAFGLTAVLATACGMARRKSKHDHQEKAETQ
jgi:hypothetical protein